MIAEKIKITNTFFVKYDDAATFEPAPIIYNILYIMYYNSKILNRNLYLLSRNTGFHIQIYVVILYH